MPFGVRCGPSRAMVACGRVAGVEEIMGFRFVRRGMFRGVVRMRFWAPGSPPQAFAWRDSMPVVPAGRPCAGLVGVAVRGGLRTG